MIRELEFKILCQRHRDEVYRYARVLLANPADAEDATQEVLLRLWRHLPRLNLFNLRAWLLRATRNYCLDQIRRRACATMATPVEDDVLAEYPDEQAVDPCHQADSNLRLEIARRALHRLPEPIKSVSAILLLTHRPPPRLDARSPQPDGTTHVDRARVAAEAEVALGYIGVILRDAGIRSEAIILNGSLETAKAKLIDRL